MHPPECAPAGHQQQRRRRRWLLRESRGHRRRHAARRTTVPVRWSSVSVETPAIARSDPHRTPPTARWISESRQFIMPPPADIPGARRARPGPGRHRRTASGRRRSPDRARVPCRRAGRHQDAGAGDGAADGDGAIADRLDRWHAGLDVGDDARRVSPRGLSLVSTTRSASRAATSPICGRLPRSRPPPQPKTTQRLPLRACATPRNARSTFPAHRAVRVIDDDHRLPAPPRRSIRPAGGSAPTGGGHRRGDPGIVEHQAAAASRLAML